MNEQVKALAGKNGQYSFEDFCAIIDILRSPGGCPWDREQSHQSIRYNFIEETYEVIEAIDENDPKKLEEELGDVLLQVGLHARMEAEKGVFDLSGVIDGICRKLILRHPHVFGNIIVDNTAQVLVNWDGIKKQEKKQSTETDVLKSVPRVFPALMRAEKLQSKAAKAGFDWPDYAGAMDKLEEEKAELAEAISGKDQDAITEELGDLLFSAVNVARFFGIQPEDALTKASDKFLNRFEAMEKAAAEKGRKLREMSLEEMDKLWNRIKGK